jgi:hypothetical protein
MTVIMSPRTSRNDYLNGQGIFPITANNSPHTAVVLRNFPRFTKTRAGRVVEHTVDTAILSM